ncbi:uncharacterized protein Z520_06557 [Fonsecaea multimorphosa CBS 102226]|uniref:UBX domain-containing protein n=1 Tax=Fonsecaea multimorphosa CBS 102226 TaxID=1442371 RepID=A0A0D2K3M0_9EURO|nr:uncharacterized protein Z520_06557 [Fonsecaea multimorphosa CBS 102226]KIX97779.1 hypothetical protein Z520_06557 [Fonsecaea multimorphosa CBS 102226]OAL23798.1 hypothetical protein AYO22_06117 [Fonsecaea multimorphosa]
MASHVVVIDSTARRATVKTTPGKNLSEVLEEACTKLGVNAAQYGLKHNNKPVDLSRSIRLSGLSSGAKLELVQLSKSAGVVSIALQLPESEARGVPNARLTDKFPSSTTLWLVLRKFEAGVAGGGATGTRNFTARGVPSVSQGSAGAGRLYYEQPVIQVMNRELASFTDLQKSLAQLGLNSGTALLRLSFRPTETPLEEAMSQIQSYFDSVEGPAVQPPRQRETPSTAEPPAAAETQPEWKDERTSQPQEETSASLPSQPETTTSSTSRPVSVFRPPSSSTPSAALMSHNEADYTPTVEHAQVHQKLLQQNSRNVRLPTEAELAAQAEEEAAKWAAVKEVEIKVRFPDQSAVSARFVAADTAADLYNFVRECLEEQYRSETFMLRNPGIRGKNEAIPDDSGKKLIKDLQLKGRVLVTFQWDDHKTSIQARSVKSVLKVELREQAQEVKVQDLPTVGVEGDDEPGIKVNVETKETSEGSGEGKKKLPKWLKGLSKK